MPTLSVRVLGDLDVQDVDLTALGSRKARTVLWLLALARGQAVSGDRLATALWGDAQPARPPDQVAVLISRLRRVIGRERVQHVDAGYRLAYDWLDADELTGLAAEIEDRQRSGNLAGAAAAARVALSLVRGEVSRSTGADPWVEGLVGELDRLVARGRRLAAAALLAAGHWVDAADAAAAVVERDPYDEDALRVLMRSYVVGGRVGSALAGYAEARRRLADDLGADPSPETEALHAAILRGELVAPASSRRPSPSRLVGRQRAFDRLDARAERARHGSVETVAVTGEAGIGKTALLQAWAGRRAAIGEVVLYASCGPLDRAVPLNALLSAIKDHLRALGRARTAEILGEDAELLAPLLGLTAAGGLGVVLADGVVGPFLLYAALLRVLREIAGPVPLVVVVDDAHLAGRALADWLAFVAARGATMTLVTGARLHEGLALPAGETIELGPLDRAAVAALVGESRVDQLLELSGGHPLFLTELAGRTSSSPLPASLVDFVVRRCDDLGSNAAGLLRSAAVLGARLDLDLLGAVLHRPVIDLLADAELALARGLLVDVNGALWFRHDLVRAALAATTSARRSALLHRELSRALQRRPDADPGDVAEHARLGGDVVVAAHYLRRAAARAAHRFDHATAEALLDDALALHPEPAGWLDRARVRTLRGRYPAAYEDVERAGSSGAAALEVGAWASYFDRRFGQAIRFAADGALIADDRDVRGRCLSVGGRTKHAAGDLGAAETMLREAIDLMSGADRVSASAWLGVVRAHQSRTDEALQLLGPAARAQIAVEHTSATLHALLFTGHAHATSGRPAPALRAFERYTEEVERRQVPRFAGRGINFTGWVLRNVGAGDLGLDRHFEALDLSAGEGIPELAIAAREDLAEEQLNRADFDAAGQHLDAAEAGFEGDLVFGWRLEMKLALLRARLALETGDAHGALQRAERLAARATAIGVPRYISVARLIGHRAQAQLGMPVDLPTVEGDLDLLERSVGLEAWWWTGEAAAALRVPRWVDRAADSVARLAAESDEHGDRLRTESARRLDRWQALSAKPA